MAIDKLVKVDLITDVAEDYTKELKKKVDVVKGSQLVETTDVEKLKGLENIKEVQVNGQKLTVGDDGIVNIDVEGVITGDNLVSDTELTEQLGQYTKTESLKDDPGIAGKYLDKETAQSTYANKNDIPKVQIPTCTQEELEEKKATAVDGDRVVVTDEEYHIYIYIGETGTGEWKDTGTHVVLTDYVQKDGDKVLVDPATVAQVDTNKSAISELQTSVEAKLDEEDLQFATQEDVLAAIQAGKAKVTG